MAKREKAKYPFPDVSGKNYELIKNGIKIYPTCYNGKFKIEVNNNGNFTTYKKVITSKEIDEAINLTIQHWYKKLKDKENETK